MLAKSTLEPAVLRRKSSKAWIQVVSHLNPVYGGIAASIQSFSEAAERRGMACPVVGFCEREEVESMQPGRSPLPTCLPPGRLRWMLDTGLRRELKNLIQKSDGVHIHGIWEAHCAVTSRLAQSTRTPYIISAHGMLERWSLQQKRFKKAIYATLIEVDNLRRARCLRALTVHEAHDYRRIGINTPVAVVPGAVEVPEEIDRQLFPRAFPALKDKRIVLFLGRLHPKKGLNLLIQAWAKSGHLTPDAHLVVAGPDAEGSRRTYEKMVDELGLNASVTFAGMLDAPMKWSALANASLFVLPSYSEGFSVSVLEAMATGLPVIVTHACHFPEVAQKGCGWVIEPCETAVEEALLEYFQSSPFDGARMGSRGRNLVESRFTWSVVGEQMASVYEWAVGGKRPDHLEMV